MVNASVEQIARQNNLSIEELRQRLAADGVNFASFRNEIRDEITTQRLREREVNEKIDISESEIDAYLAEQAGIKGDDKMEYHVEHILLPVETPAENDSVKTAAESLAKRARDGENFSSLAASFSRADDAMKGYFCRGAARKFHPGFRLRCLFAACLARFQARRQTRRCSSEVRRRPCRTDPCPPHSHVRQRYHA
jgi:parvulin-like peptidyl-prolyl isomerase